MKRNLKTNLGNGNFIFVGSSCDMFAHNIPDKWIRNTMEHCDKFDNRHTYFRLKTLVISVEYYQ